MKKTFSALAAALNLSRSYSRLQPAAGAIRAAKTNAAPYVMPLHSSFEGKPTEIKADGNVSRMRGFPDLKVLPMTAEVRFISDVRCPRCSFRPRSLRGSTRAVDGVH